MECGKFINTLVTHTGTVYAWGKGHHERPKFNDYYEYSSPYIMLEEKQIVHVSVGLSHAMALDRFGQLYGWGASTLGCLGSVDQRGRATPGYVSFFQNKRVIDVSCGELFTVVIAEVEGDPNAEVKKEFDEFGKLIKKPKKNMMERILQIRKDAKDDRLVTIRKPICGGGFFSQGLKDKITNIMIKN